MKTCETRCDRVTSLKNKISILFKFLNAKSSLWNTKENKRVMKVWLRVEDTVNRNAPKKAHFLDLVAKLKKICLETHLEIFKNIFDIFQFTKSNYWYLRNNFFLSKNLYNILDKLYKIVLSFLHLILYQIYKTLSLWGAKVRYSRLRASKFWQTNVEFFSSLYFINFQSLIGFFHSFVHQISN